MSPALASSLHEKSAMEADFHTAYSVKALSVSGSRLEKVQLVAGEFVHSAVVALALVAQPRKS